MEVQQIERVKTTQTAVWREVLHTVIFFFQMKSLGWHQVEFRI